MKTSRMLPIVAFVLLIWNQPLAAQPVITTDLTNLVVLNGSNAVFNVAASGGGPFTYRWQFNGNPIPLLSTVAGNGSAGYSGDDNAATSAAVNFPTGVAVDNAGNLFIADPSQNRIRKVDTNGIITLVAGNGGSGWTGDGGAPTNATFNYPSGVAVDNAGNLFIADYYNDCIRKVDTNGIITTVAGIGTVGFSGDGSAATNAGLANPYGVAADNAGNVFIADSSNNRIRKVDATGIITTVAGGGSTSGEGIAATNVSLYNPSGVAVDKAGNLFIADTGNNRICMVDLNGIFTTVAGGGSLGDGNAATNASLNLPYGVAVDNAGNVFIADCFNHRVRKVDVNGIITTVGGNGSGGFSGDGIASTNGSVFYPYGVAADAGGNVFIADSYNHRIREVSTAANVPTFTVLNITTNSLGNYAVIVSNSSGSVTSSVAALNMPPYIITQPNSRTGNPMGSSPSFSVTAAGSLPIGYQLYFAGTNLVQGGPSSTLTLLNVSANNSGYYTVVITNAYGSVTSQVAWLIVDSPAVLTHRYAFNTNADDLVGSAHGTVLGNAYITNGMLFLDGTNGSVQLPNNLFTSYDSLSFETWFADAAINNENAQLYSFSGTNGALTYSLYGQGAYLQKGVSSVVNLPSPAVGRTNHLVWTQNGATAVASLYVNGILAGTTANFTATPSLIGSTTTNRLGAGKTNSTALNFKGRMLEFRTYQGALSPLEVALLDAFGPDQPLTNSGALQAVRVVVPSPTGPGALFRAGVFADFSAITNVNISTQPDLVLSSDNTNVITIASDQRLRTRALGVANLTAVWQGFSNTLAVTVGVPQDIALMHRYGFNERTNDWIVHDSIGVAHGRLFNTGTHGTTNGVFTGNGEMKLAGGYGYGGNVGGYAALPAGILSSLSEVTVEAWVTWTTPPYLPLTYGNGAWQRIFDFGSQYGGQGVSYFDLSPASDNVSYTTKSVLFASVTTSLNYNEKPRLTWTNAFPTNVNAHVAVSYSPVRGITKVYLNGIPIMSGTAIYPLAGIIDANNWLGRSQFSSDAYFFGRYNEFRVYQGQLSDADVAADYAAGPDVIGVDYVLHTYASSNNGLTITWGPSVTNRVLQSSRLLGAGAAWTSVTNMPVLQNGRYGVTVPLTDAAAFFRLSQP